MTFHRRCCWCQKPFIQYRHGREFFWGCSTKACMARQAQWAIQVQKNGEGRPVYLPLPKQVEAIEAVFNGKARWILYGGARGGAKSHYLRWLAYLCCLRFPGFQVVLLRRTYPELEKSHLRRVPGEVAKIKADPVLSAKPPVVRFKNGSILEFGHCQDEGAIENYLSAEYHMILFDEVGTFTEDMVIRIGSSARPTSNDFRPCIVAATNPGSRWIYDRWIIKEVDRDRYPNYDPEDYCFIQSKLEDNPYPDPEYERFLDSLDPVTKAAWRDGRWDLFEGQFFSEFRSELHVRTLEIPPDVPRIGGLDWGYAKPGVLLWAVVLPDGHLHIEREYKFTQQLAEDVALTAQQMSRDYGIRSFGPIAADPSMWIRTGQSGESIAETFARAGMPLMRANHERVNGWQRVRHWLRTAPDGVPWLTIDPGCTYGLRTLPAATFDKTNHEDLDTDGDDHWIDACRYLSMSRPAPFRIETIKEPAPESAGALFREALAGAVSSGKLGSENVLAR